MPAHFLYAFLLAAPLLAQDIPVRTQEPALKQQTQSEAAKAAEQAKKREVEGGEPDVTYDQILAKPDDTDLNYRYARSLVKKGNLRGAVATLERILMIKPDLAKARLFYAIVLLRVGNLDAAEREFQKLQSGKVPDELRAELDGYLVQLRRLNRKTRLTAVVGAGLDYDDNRNAAPASAQRLLVDIPITLDSGSTRKSDVAKIMLGNLGLVHEYGQAGHQVWGSAGYYRAEQTNVTSLNLQNYSVSVGALYKTGWVDVLPSFEFDHLLLAQTTYLRSREFRLKLARALNDVVDVYADGAYARQLYNRTDVVPTGDQRTGDKVAGGLGAGVALGQSNRLSLGYEHVTQGAAANFDAYQRESVALEDISILPRGQFVLLSATAYFDRYLQPEQVVSAKFRNDNNYRARATYGLPLGVLARSFEDALWTFTYEYYEAHSTITNYSYSNNRVSALLTYKWSRGL